jgi:large subunit ribosomal protein L4
MPRKSLRVALMSALLGKLRDGEVRGIDEIALEAPRTREVAKAFRGLELEGTTLLVLPEANDVAYRSGRNIPGARVRVASDVNAYEILKHRNVVVVGDALERLRERVA